MTSVAPSVRSARFALGVAGLLLLFGLGYRISLRRLGAPAAEVGAQVGAQVGDQVSAQ